MRSTFARLVCFVAMLIALVPGAALAQAGAIAGVVRDTTGAILPGVTVEAASPALIEKVRSAVTDESGQYRIIDLRPGTYSVTFTLPGFATVKREGLELVTGFTATVNAEMKVGGVEETVVVTGQSPLVDVQNVRQQRVMTREVVDTIPTGRSFDAIGVLIPGVSSGQQEVGGATGNQFQRLVSHGGRVNDQQTLVDGMSVAQVQSLGGSISMTTLSDGNVQETTIQIGAHSAEAETGGIVVNLVPKTGGNDFSGSFFGNFATETLQSDNFTDELRARGLRAPDKIKNLADLNPTLGGPIRRDRLWFFGGYRHLRRVNYASNKFPDVNPNDFVFTPDLSAQLEDPQIINDYLGRVTWQIDAVHKLSGSYNYNKRRDGSFQPIPNSAFESTWNQTAENHIAQVTWTAPITSRLLLDGGMSLYKLRFLVNPQSGSVGPAALDIGTGVLFRSQHCGPCSANALTYRDLNSRNLSMRGSVAYVTGTHSLKFGARVNPAKADFFYWNLADTLPFGPYEVRVLNGAPTAAVFLPTPFSVIDQFNKVGLYGQDQWTLKRLTINAGVRFDWFRTSYPDVDLSATTLLPARQFPGAEVLHWKDLSPRLGASFDLFGDSKTALKVSYSRYALQEGTDLTRLRNPAVTSGGILQRTWRDVNGDFVPQGDPLNPAANGELGPSPNANFGQPRVTLTYDPEWASGFGVRPNQWEFSTGVQREVMPGLSVNGAYFRRMYGQFTVTDNTLVAPSDYSPFCVTAPRDERLPNGGGQEICGLFDLNPSKLGQIQEIRTSSDRYGEQIERWHGVDLNAEARFQGVLLQGGVSTGNTLQDNCDVVSEIDNPSPLYCRTETLYLTQVKFLGSYTFPGQIQVAATYQNVPGPQITANYVARNAEIAPSLRRNLSAGPNGTVTVNLIEPGREYGDRLSQLDVRFARTFRRGDVRVKAMVDLYNALNASTILSLNTNYGTNGAAWLRPLRMLTGRIVKFGAQVDF